MEHVRVWGGIAHFTSNAGMLIIDLDRLTVDGVARAYFHTCKLTNLASFLRTNRNITSLKLHDCVFQDTFSLDHVNTITRLEVDNTPIDNGIDDIPPEVVYLSLQNLPELKSIDFMRSNTSIWCFRLANTGVRSLEPLRFNTSITLLDISQSPIESLEPLRSNRTITNYCVKASSFVDLSPLWSNTSIISWGIGYYTPETRLQAQILAHTFRLNAMNAKLRRMTLRSLSKTHI